MAEKDGGRYLYEQYTTKPQNNGATGTPLMMTTTAAGTLKKVDPPSSLKSCGKSRPDGAGLEDGAGGGGEDRKSRCCSCMSPKAVSFWFAMLTNLGIFGLLLSYTLLGKYGFLFFFFCV